MKHLTILALFTLHFSLFTLSTSAGIPMKWTVETSRAVPAQFEAYQGETLALEAALQSYGKPLEAPSNYSLYWQTNGMGNAYWSTPCTVPASSLAGASNVLFATWSPTNDVGAKVYNCFIGKPGTIYHAAFQLRLRPSPGATPNELPLPTPVIDFAKVTVLNPPWSGGGGGVDTNAVIDIANATIATNPVVVAKLDGPTFAPTNTADASGKAADARLTGVALTNRYTKAETDAKLSPIAAQLAALQDGKRGIEDLDVYEDAEQITLQDGESDLQHSAFEHGIVCTRTESGFALSNYYFPSTSDASLMWTVLEPSYDERNGKVWWTGFRSDGGPTVDFFYDISNVKVPSGDHLAKESQLTEKRDKTDGDFTGTTIRIGDEGFEGVEISGSTFNGRIKLGWDTGLPNIDLNGNFPGSIAKVTVGNDIVSGSIEVKSPNDDFGNHASIKKDGKEVATEEYVDGSISTNNPAFVSAVRNTPTSGMPDDMPTDWGTYGTVGAALAALAAFVKWAKAKIVAVIGDDGKPTDQFATDILGKPVAKEAVQDIVNEMFDNGDTTAYPRTTEG